MIPLATLYYLLCYAWNRLPAPALLRAAEATPFRRPLELLAQVLAHGLRRWLRAGAPLAFVAEEAELTELRGRVLLASSLGRGLLARGRAVCVFEELTCLTPLATLLAATVGALLAAPGLPATLRRELRGLRVRLPTVPAGAAPPTAATFAALRRQRPAGEGQFLLHVSELIWRHALPAPAAAGRARFPDFRRDERLMAQLFEQFVRNFYRREQRQYRVFAETISWQATAPGAPDEDAQAGVLALLPTMLTDTTLESPTRKIILDTKYYAAALRPRYDQQKLISPHLYQLYAYLQNQRPAPGQALEGILLYPAAAPGAALDVRYTLGGHPVRVLTLNLDQPWPGIHADLLALVG